MQYYHVLNKKTKNYYYKEINKKKMVLALIAAGK